MNVDVRAHRAAADARASTPDVDTRQSLADLQQLARRRSRSHAAFVAAVALAALSVVGLFAVNSDRNGATSPMSPVPDAPSVPPSATDWSALLERDTSAVQTWGEAWEDPDDSPMEGVDLTRVDYYPAGFPGWGLGLAGWPQRATLEEGTVLSYGVVVDSTRDGVADYLLGLDRRGKSSGDDTYRVWVTDLATDETEVQDGGPYGYPFDFAHGVEKSDGTAWMSLFFLSTPPFEDPKRARWYAFSALSQDGEVVAWDTAPDSGWLYNR